LSDESKSKRGPVPSEKLEKLIHLALPVRLTHMSNGRVLEMACTYDIHPRGARLLSASRVNVGDMLTIERGRHRCLCQVVWTADPNSTLRGQFTVQTVDGGKVPWEEELRQMEEQYLPVDPEKKLVRYESGHRRGDQNRRRKPRFAVEGGAEVAEIGGKTLLDGRLAQLSESGCIIAAPALLVPGTGLSMVLSVHDVTVALKGQVKYKTEKVGMGVEFHEIRQGDRPLLNYVLGELGKRRGGEFEDLEVVTETTTVEAG
jgi:hypothetical protein